MAQTAVANALHRLLQRQRNVLSAHPVVLQQVVSHARGRSNTHPRQAPQGFDQRGQRNAMRHNNRPRTAASCPVAYPACHR